MYRRLIGVDPGLVTGLVNVGFDEDGKLYLFEAFQLDHMGVGEYFAGLAASKSPPIPPVVLVERFIINQASAKKSPAPWSLETTGIVRYFSMKAGIEPIFQLPSQTMGLIKDDVLKRAGMYTPGMGHSNDAARQILYFAMTELGIQKECLKP